MGINVADRMVDLGFEEDLNYILGAMPLSNLKPDNDFAEDAEWLISKINSNNPYRQTVMYSATMPSALDKIAQEYFFLI